MDSDMAFLGVNGEYTDSNCSLIFTVIKGGRWGLFIAVVTQ